MSNHHDNSFGRSDQYQNPLLALNKLSGHKQEAHHKLVNGILKEMHIKEDELNDITRLHMEAIQRVKIIRQYAQAVRQGEFEGGIEHNVERMIADLTPRFLDAFHHYDKDQLLNILTLMLVEVTMKEAS